MKEKKDVNCDNKNIDDDVIDNKLIEKNNSLIKYVNNKIKLLNFNLLEVFLIIIMSIVLGYFACKIFDGNSANSNKVYNSEIDKVYDTLITNYNGTIDQKGLSDAAIEGMINFLGDKYSIYFDQEEANDFNTELDGSFIGIGVEITLDEKNIPTVASVFDDSVASEADIKDGDKFIKVDGVDVSNSSLEDLALRIKGNKSRTLTLTMQRGDELVEKIVTTKKVEINSVTSEIFEKDNKKIGYIYISIFAANTAEQFEKTYNELVSKNIDSLIVDVRGNLGGHLSSATSILNLFLDKSQILYQLKENDKITKVYGKNASVFDKKVVVLADSTSASASEVLTSALVEAYGATFIGTKTYGKGTVQTTLSLSSGSMIKYTSEEWLTSNGNSINENGIVPTIDISLNDDYFTDYDKEKDNQLQTAIKYLTDK